MIAALAINNKEILRLKIKHYKETQKGLFRAELQRRLVAKKKELEFLWLNEVNS